MKKTLPRKTLRLETLTIRTITANDLQTVAGGSFGVASCAKSCGTNLCDTDGGGKW